jgi:hypothetical protein
MDQYDSPQPSNKGNEAARNAPAVVPETSIATSTALDAHGFNPDEYDWVPVRKVPRADGLSPQKQRDFISALADTGSVTDAARAVGMSRKACYELRRSPGAEQFDAAWQAARAESSKQLIDIAFDRAINGVEEPVFDKNGQRIACRYRYNDRLLMFLIRANAPEQYRLAHRDMRGTDEPLPPPAPPVAEALQRLEPAMPPEPHRLMARDELEIALECADILPGKLPHWRRDPDPVPVQYPMGEAFERQLEAAKREASSLPPPREGDGEDCDFDYDDDYVGDDDEPT